MKKSVLPLLILLLSISFFSCKKKDDNAPTPTSPYSCSTCNSTPEALAANDNQGAGIYKGVLVGSSGAYKLILQGGEKKVIVKFDNIVDTLTTTGTITAGQPIDLIFTGTKGISMNFTVNADGSSPTVSVTIPNHTVIASITKEVSTEVLKIYEGTYTGSSTGALNIWVRGTDGIAVTKSSNIRLAINGNSVNNVGGSVVVSGTIKEDETSGTWNNTSNSTSGNWSGKRVF